MAQKQVRAMYDFDAQPGSGEMSIKMDEILVVLRDNVEGGWVEGKNVRGSVGLFPKTYVEPHYSSPSISPPMPPPTAPPAPPPMPPMMAAKPMISAPISSNRGAVNDDWGTTSFTPSAAPSVAPSFNQGLSNNPSLIGSGSASQIGGDDFDDEWTDEEEADDHRLAVGGHECGSPVGRPHSANRPTDYSSEDDYHTDHSDQRRRSSSRTSERRSNDTRNGCRGHRRSKDTSSHVTHVPTRRDNQSVVSRSASAGAAGGKANRNINRFSNFVKSGMEAYVLGDTKMNGQPGERHDISTSGSMVQWRPIQQYYTCVVDKPKKESKMKGLKSFIAYTITSSLRGIQVSRRYKHFDWLHERLSAKYCLIPIPPLPEKQVSGRYEEDLIDHRKHILQLWVNKICRHPVLSQSEVWLHFITSTDERDWKNGKRRAEKDEYIGGNFLHCVNFPSGHLDNNNVEKQVEKFQRSVKCTEDAMRTMQERLQVFQKLYQGPVKSNWQKMALSFSTMGQAFNTDEHPVSNKMKDALNHTAHQYHTIGEDFDVHTRNDMEPVVENLYSFKGTVQAVPDILNVHKQCIQKLRENEGKVSVSDAERIRQRVDTTSYAVMAEMNHLNAEKIEDFRVTMSTYVKRQAEFYQKIANNFAELARHYDF